MKKYLWILVVIFILLLAGIFCFARQSFSDGGAGVSSIPTQALSTDAYKTVPLVMDGHTFTAEIADTSTLQQLGLSYRSSISASNAMLFVFPSPQNLQFWMKDMNFPIDIIWLDSGKKVVYIGSNLAPDTYPQTFGPSTKSQYVIEVAAGTAQNIGLKVGDEVIFSCDNYFCMR